MFSCTRRTVCVGIGDRGIGSVLSPQTVHKNAFHIEHVLIKKFGLKTLFLVFNV